MKLSWDLPGLSLNLEPLWKNPSGPSWQAAYGGLMATSEQALLEKFRSGKVGFYDWPKDSPLEEIERMAIVAKKLRKEFQGALCIGIGGSFLGPAATLDALRAPEEQEAFPIHWLSNADSSSIRKAKHFSKGRKIATVVLSKSGGTTETLSGFFHLSSQLKEKGFVVVTDPKSGELRRLAKKYAWENFEVPANIGGRFSVLTAVGLFPSFLGGLPAEELLEGAREMRSSLERFAPAENPAYLYALASFLWDTEGDCKIQYLMPYATNLKPIADWYVQLWAESLGKEKRGFTPVAALGTSDQHSVLQLLKEGPRDKVVGFIELDEKEAPTIGEPSFAADPSFKFLYSHTFTEIAVKASRATEQSLRNSEVPTYRFRFPALTAKTLGAFFFFQEVACAFAGELYGIHAFDQPGVEESKKLLEASLKA